MGCCTSYVDEEDDLSTAFSVKKTPQNSDAWHGDADPVLLYGKSYDFCFRFPDDSIFTDETQSEKRGNSSEYERLGGGSEVARSSADTMDASGSLAEDGNWTKKSARKTPSKGPPRRRRPPRQGSKPLKDRITPAKATKEKEPEPEASVVEEVLVVKAEPPREPSLALPDISHESVVTENNDEMEALFSKPQNGKDEEDIFESDDEMDSLFAVKKTRQVTEDIFAPSPSSPRDSSLDGEVDTPKSKKDKKKSRKSEKKERRSRSRSGSSERPSRSSRSGSSERKSSSRRSGSIERKSRSSKSGRKSSSGERSSIERSPIGGGSKTSLENDDLDDLFAVKPKPKQKKPADDDLDDLFAVSPKAKVKAADDDELDDLFAVKKPKGGKPGHRRRGSAASSSRGSKGSMGGSRGSESRRSTQSSDIFAGGSSDSSSSSD
jgi:hypothetical protein